MAATVLTSIDTRGEPCPLRTPPTTRFTTPHETSRMFCCGVRPPESSPFTNRSRDSRTAVRACSASGSTTRACRYGLPSEPSKSAAVACRRPPRRTRRQPPAGIRRRWPTFPQPVRHVAGSSTGTPTPEPRSTTRERRGGSRPRFPALRRRCRRLRPSLLVSVAFRLLDAYSVTAKSARFAGRGLVGRRDNGAERAGLREPPGGWIRQAYRSAVVGHEPNR